MFGLSPGGLTDILKTKTLDQLDYTTVAGMSIFDEPPKLDFKLRDLLLIEKISLTEKISDIPRTNKGSVEWYQQVGSKRAIAVLTLAGIAGSIVTAVASVVIGPIILAISAIAFSIILVSGVGRSLEKDRLGAFDGSIYSAIKTGFSRLSCTRKNKPEVKGAPILYLHGMLCQRKSGNWLLDKVKDLGPVHRLNMGTKLKSVGDCDYQKEIERCSAKVTEYAKKNFGDQPVTIIAHSRGGVVAMDVANKIPVGKIVTLGSPLNKKGEYLKELTKKVYENTSTKFLHMASTVDTVVPKDSALPKEIYGANVQTRVFTHLGHTGFLYSDRVVEEVRHFIV